MFRVILGMLIWGMCVQVGQAQTSTLTGKYWLFIKEANLKTEEYFEIKPDGQAYTITWPDHSVCKLVPDAGNSYHLECKDEKMKIEFDEAADKKIKGFAIVLANEKMYGVKD
jgi:hypothetical protein